MHIGNSRNEGLKLARGKYVGFCDHDDCADSTMFEMLYNHAEKEALDLVCSPYVSIKNGVLTIVDDFPVATPEDFSRIFLETTIGVESNRFSKVFMSGTVWNKLFRKSIIEKMDSYPNVFNPEIYYGEDLDFAFRYLTHCSSASYTPCKLYYYRSRKGSEVHSKFNAKKMLSIFSAHDRNIELCSKKFPSVEKYVRAFKCVSCVEMLFRIYPSNFDNVEVIKKLFNELKSNMKSLKQSKKVQRYKRWTIPFVPPLLKLILRKKIKKQKQ